MRHALLQVVRTEMCVDSVCTQPPYNDKDPPSVFFILVKSFPIFHINPFSDACLCDVTQTQAPPTIVDWHWCFSLDPPWVRCFVVGCHNEHSSRHLLLSPNIWAAEDAEDYVCFWRECALDLPKCVYLRANHSWSSFTSRRSENKVF